MRILHTKRRRDASFSCEPWCLLEDTYPAAYVCGLVFELEDCGYCGFVTAVFGFSATSLEISPPEAST